MSIWPDHSLAPLFEFAKAYLGIRTRSFLWCYTVEKKRPDCGFAGIYSPDTRSITFNGMPSWATVFHECVHYWQHEKEGAGFLKAYENSRAELRIEFIVQGVPESVVDQMAYNRCPYEIEAREKSYEMATIYRNKMAGIGAHWA